MKVINKGSMLYTAAYEQMQLFTQNRSDSTEDEVWLVEHPPIFTFGRHADPTHLINPHGIEVAHTDRGGQVTYHGPGQLVVYFLCDLKRMNVGAREFVCTLESLIIQFLRTYGIEGERIERRPGIYVAGAKIASIGLRIKRAKTYHGISLNVDMDLTPFQYINPCGYEGLEMTQIKSFQADLNFSTACQAFKALLENTNNIGHTHQHNLKETTS